MHLTPVSIGTTFIVMGFMEALFKPLTITFFKYRIFPYVGQVLQVADPVMPEKIKEKTGDELQAWLIDVVVQQTQDPSWRDNPFKKEIALKQIEGTYSPSVNADNSK